mgnify:CR=1 FL=1
MIITCPCKKKKFEIDAALIPEEGRNLKCGSCEHVWFFKKDLNNLKEKLEIQKNEETQIIKDQPTADTKVAIKPISAKNNLNKTSKKKSEIVKYQHKKKFGFSTFLSYIIVAIISFCALIILRDTFKSPLYNIFPDLELILYSLFETLKDIQLFIKDLI